MRNIKRMSTEVNSGSMADIAFLLLIFFMVATTLQRDKTISMKLPPLSENKQPQAVNEKLVVTIIINGQNEVMIENEIVNRDILPVLHYHLKTLVSQDIKPIINIKMHPSSEYDAYLIILSQIKKAIRLTKEDESKRRYGLALDQLSRDTYLELSKQCGIRITEIQTKA